MDIAKRLCLAKCHQQSLISAAFLGAALHLTICSVNKGKFSNWQADCRCKHDSLGNENEQVFLCKGYESNCTYAMVQCSGWCGTCTKIRSLSAIAKQPFSTWIMTPSRMQSLAAPLDPPGAELFAPAGRVPAVGRPQIYRGSVKP